MYRYTENNGLGALLRYLQCERSCLKGAYTHRFRWHAFTQFPHVYYGCLTVRLGTTTDVSKEQSAHSLSCHFLPPTLFLCPSPALFSLTTVCLLNSPLV